jgi:type IV secretion system protein VirB8
MTFPRPDAASAPPRAIGAPSRKGYYDEAATWSADINASLRASRRVAWTVAAAACLVAVLEALALVALTPLKTVVPDIITVDRQTGYVQEVNGLRAGPLTQDQAVTQAFLVQYVIARETFDATDLRDDYHKVMLWSAGDARAQYQTLMQRTTPNSPLALYSPTTQVSVTINSVSLLSPTTALVRFQTTRHEAESSTASQQSWAAVLAFRYTQAPMSNGDRFLDPLGFQVTRYRRDAETLTPTAVDAAPVEAPTATAAGPATVPASASPTPAGSVPGQHP